MLQKQPTQNQINTHQLKTYNNIQKQALLLLTQKNLHKSKFAFPLVKRR